MRQLIIGFCLLCGAVTSTLAQVSVGIGMSMPGLSIGINLPFYPDLVRVPGYPVYYAPQVDANFFFYDGMYWVFQDDNWYASAWYNGPWDYVDPFYVPVFVLRVPVRYYRVQPPYFRGWRDDAPPRWGEHWGQGWSRGRPGWDQWNRRAAPPPAPLPAYQRPDSGEHYPQQEQQQRSLRDQHYRYQPRDPVVRQYQQRPPAQQSAPEPDRQRPAPQPDATRRDQPERPHGQVQGQGHDQGQQGQARDKNRDKDDDRGQGRKPPHGKDKD